MIHRQKGKIIIECDSCPEVFEGDDDGDFASFWNAAKRDGWHVRKIDDQWLHGCSNCGVPT